MRYAVIFLVVLGLAGTSQAAIVTAASCNNIGGQTDVQDAIDAASPGDTVFMPAGTCTWDTNVLVNGTPLRLLGAGIGRTVISETVTGDYALTFRVSSPDYYELGSFSLIGSTTGIRESILITRATTQLYVHDIECEAGAHDCFYANGARGRNVGVMSNLVLRRAGGSSELMTLDHDEWAETGGDRSGHQSWTEPAYWGTQWWLSIEDSHMYGVDTGAITFAYDGDKGARIRWRHNVHWNITWTNHGTEGQRGFRALEMHGNTFEVTVPGFSRGGYILLRSGSFLIYDNFVDLTGSAGGTVTNMFGAGYLRETEPLTSYEGPHGCNRKLETLSGCPNTALALDETDGIIHASGTHNGGADSADLVDTTKAWTVSQWALPKGPQYVVLNRTAVTGTVQSSAPIIANTETTLTHLTGGGTTNILPLWQPGDAYEVRYVTHPIDIYGKGAGNLLVGVPPQPGGWPNQADEASYAWNNAKDEGSGPEQIGWSSAQFVVAEEDIVSAPMPGYAPYTHPHPLRRQCTRHQCMKPSGGVFQ